MRESLGDLLKRERIHKGYTLRDVSNKIGIAYSYINSIEKGENKMSLDKMLLFSKFYSIPLEIMLIKAGYESDIIEAINNVERRGYNNLTTYRRELIHLAKDESIDEEVISLALRLLLLEKERSQNTFNQRTARYKFKRRNKNRY